MVYPEYPCYNTYAQPMYTPAPYYYGNPYYLQQPPRVYNREPIRLDTSQAAVDKSFLIKNLPNINAVDIDTDGLKYKVLYNKDNGDHMIKFDTKGDEHTVSVMQDGDHVIGSPFRLIPKEPEIDVQPENRMFTLSNIHNLSELEIRADGLVPKPVRDAVDKGKYHVYLEPYGKHKIDVRYKGKTIKNGKFTLAPHPSRQYNSYRNDGYLPAYPLYPYPNTAYMTPYGNSNPMSVPMISSGVPSMYQQPNGVNVPPAKTAPNPAVQPSESVKESRERNKENVTGSPASTQSSQSESGYTRLFSYSPQKGFY